MFAFTNFEVHPTDEYAVSFSSVVRCVRAYDTSYTVESAAAKLASLSRDEIVELGLDADYLGCDPDCEPVKYIVKYVAAGKDPGVFSHELYSVLCVLFDGWSDLAIDCINQCCPDFEAFYNGDDDDY